MSHLLLNIPFKFIFSLGKVENIVNKEMGNGKSIRKIKLYYQEGRIE